MNIKKLTCASIILALLIGCGEKEVIQTNDSMDTPKAENIKAHLEFLADDTLKGRDTGSEGYQIAANYVKSNFKQLGLLPMGENQSFEQQVTFRKTVLEEGGANLVITNQEGDVELKEVDDFIISGSPNEDQMMVEAETVFVGYGVIAPDFGYDDYKDIDVEGKIVIALTGRPDDLPSEEGAHLGSGSEKIRHAAERGAVGFITIHTPKRDKVRSFDKAAKYASSPRFTWLDSKGQPYGNYQSIKGLAYVNYVQAEALFVGASTSLEQLLLDDTNNKAINGFALNAKVKLSAKSHHEEVTSPNIIAMIPGSDEKLKDEYVVFSGHLDHIGIDEHSDDEDKINNGALDNASGVSILLETARLLSNMPKAPKRSILFVIVTGEEKGLLGSSYYANNPTVPLMSMVANVNLDMPIILYPFADVVAFGSTHSSLGNVVETAANKINISLSPDPMPEQAIFTRSDHYSFVKQGIPSVFMMTGFKSTDENINGGEVFGDFLKNHYHQHSDQLDLPINYEAAAKFALVNMMIGLEIANQDKRPTWNKGDFFGKTFAM